MNLSRINKFKIPLSSGRGSKANAVFVFASALVLFTSLVFVSCRGISHKADAYGNFETREIMVMSELSGRLIHFRISEGEYLDSGKIIGIVDTTMLDLQGKQIQAKIRAVLSQKSNLRSQSAIIDAQISNTDKEISRVINLLADGATPQKQLDDLRSARDVLIKQKEALNSQEKTVIAETEVLQAQLEQIKEQVKRSEILMPVSGHILVKYAEEGELVNPGRSICKIGDLHTLILRAYVSGNQLTEISIGKDVTVRIDGPENSFMEYPGRVDWISPTAEFTPKIVQTREERVNLVYAIKVSVKNDGALKIGMPGEIYFNND